MANYFEKSTLLELDIYRKKIFELREEAYKKFNIDILDNDTLSALSIYEIVKEYDLEYNINFARNGEDGKSGKVLIEQKASRVKKKKKTVGVYDTASFQFHAMGDIEYNRYIFATRDKETLSLIRLYDISIKDNILKIQQHLLGERKKWEDKNKQLGYTQKRDVIVLPENLLFDLINVKKQIINNVEVIQA
jgi:hypothetical protein